MQTEIIIHDGESILYSKEWLNRSVDTDDMSLIFNTNRDVVTGKVKAPKDFINPYRWPELLDEERKQSKMRAGHWKDYIELNYPGINAREQYRLRKEELYWQEIKDCGKPMHKFDKKLGKLVVAYYRRCKHYKDCPKCGDYKKEQARSSLTNLIDTTKYIEGTEEEIKKFVRKYGTKKFHRIPLPDNRAAIIIDTEDEIGEVFTQDKLNKVIHHYIPDDNRRVSGKLGVNVPVVKKEEKKEEELNWDKIEEELDKEKHTCECHYREMSIDFDSNSKEAPQTIQDIQQMVEDEVDIDNPDTKEKLQDAIFVCEQKVMDICHRYGMSFNFSCKKIEYIDIREVDWKWTKNKRKT